MRGRAPQIAPHETQTLSRLPSLPQLHSDSIWHTGGARSPKQGSQRDHKHAQKNESLERSSSPLPPPPPLNPMVVASFCDPVKRSKEPRMGWRRKRRRWRTVVVVVVVVVVVDFVVAVNQQEEKEEEEEEPDVFQPHLRGRFQ